MKWKRLTLIFQSITNVKAPKCYIFSKNAHAPESYVTDHRGVYTSTQTALGIGKIESDNIS